MYVHAFSFSLERSSQNMLRPLISSFSADTGLKVIQLQARVR